MPSKRKARCVYCGKPKSVTTKGKIRKHWITSGPTTVNPGKRVPCGGSGRVV